MRSPLLRLAGRELRNRWRFSLFFCLNLAAGLLGLLLVLGLRDSLSDAIDRKSQVLLSADLAVSARRPLLESERETLRIELPNYRVSELIDLFSMVRARSADGTHATPEGSERLRRTRLGQLRAVDPLYPQYGELRLRKRGVVGAGAAAQLMENSRLEAESASPSRKEEAGAWIDQRLASELGLQIGDRIEAGGIPLRVDDVVEEDSSAGFAALAFGPRIYLPLDVLKKSSLLSFGSTANYQLLFQKPTDRISPEEITQKESRLNLLLADPAVRVRGHRRASEESSRLLGYLSDYLGLVSLSALLLASLGAVFQFRRYFLSKSREIAVLLALGLTRKRALGIFLLQLAVLSALAAGVAGLLAGLFLPTLGSWFDRWTPSGAIAWRLRPQVAFLGLLIGVGTSFLLCVPQLVRLKGLSPAALFREDFNIGERPEFSRAGAARTRWRFFTAYFPAILFFALLAVILAQSVRTGLLFVAGILLAGLILPGAGVLGVAGIYRFLERSKFLKYPSLRLAVRHLARSRGTTWLSSLTLGLATLLVTLIPQLKASLQADLIVPSDRPSFFLFDIQDEQLAGVQALFREKIGAAPGDAPRLSPLVRARLLKVNGRSFEKEVRAGSAFFQSREQEQEQGLRNRGLNLTFRERLSQSETLVAGRDFEGSWRPDSGKLPELSVEERYAERMGWHLGDVLQFDIQGVPLSGVIVNFRSVRWTSFQPNFFVQFQPGVLEETPKSWLAAVPALSQQAKLNLQDGLVEKFPNVGIVDVGEVISVFERLSRQVTTALVAMSLWSVLAGALTLLAIARYEAFSRRWDMNLLKVLGARAYTVLRVFLWESFTISLFSAGLGACLSLGMSAALSKWVFDSPWSPDLRSAGITFALSVAISLGIAFLSALRVWREKPLGLLNSENAT